MINLLFAKIHFCLSIYKIWSKTKTKFILNWSENYQNYNRCSVIHCIKVAADICKTAHLRLEIHVQYLVLSKERIYKSSLNQTDPVFSRNVHLVIPFRRLKDIENII